MTPRTGSRIDDLLPMPRGRAACCRRRDASFGAAASPRSDAILAATFCIRFGPCGRSARRPRRRRATPLSRSGPSRAAAAASPRPNRPASTGTNRTRRPAADVARPRRAVAAKAPSSILMLRQRARRPATSWGARLCRGRIFAARTLPRPPRVRRAEEGSLRRYRRPERGERWLVVESVRWCRQQTAHDRVVCALRRAVQARNASR